MDKNILKIRNLVKQYDNSQNVILKGIDLDLNEEDFLCILGPSGCGKSTMIRCIAGFEGYEGTIEVSGEKVTKPGVSSQYTVFCLFFHLHFYIIISLLLEDKTPNQLLNVPSDTDFETSFYYMYSNPLLQEHFSLPARLLQGCNTSDENAGAS